MIEDEKLTLSYLQNHPQEASQVLESIPVETVATFLENIPVRICANVIASMTPHVNARLLPYLSEEKRHTLLRDLNVQLCARILRHTEKQVRVNALKNLPTNLSWRIKVLLNYPQGTIGAVMNPDIRVARLTQTVQDAIDMIQETSGEESFIYVVDSQQHLTGYIMIGQLLVAGKQTALRHLMRPRPPSLPARASLSSAGNNPAWSNHGALPVVDRDNKIVGILSLTSLVQNTPAEEEGSEHMGLLMGNILDTYWTGWLSMLDVIFSKSRGGP